MEEIGTTVSAGEFADWVTGIVLILGLLGGFWKWFVADGLRRRLDYLKLDGVAAATTEGWVEDDGLVKIACVWRNIGHRKIEIDEQKTQIFVYDTLQFEEMGPVDAAAADVSYLFSAQPYGHSSGVVYEAGTESECSAIFRLKSDVSYVARIVLAVKEGSKAPKNTVWTRTVAFSVARATRIAQIGAEL